MRLAIIIPAYNEATVIEGVLRAIPRTITGISEVIPVVVDDNSTDETARLVKQLGHHCISHRLNLGAGGATITGFALAKLLEADFIVTLDGDGQHDPAEIKRLIKPLLNQQADVVIGSRMMNTNGMPRHKRLVNWLANFVTFAFSRLWVTDSQSGYKAFTRQAIERIDLLTTGYEFCSEIIREVRVNNLRLVQLPIRNIYTDYSKRRGQPVLNSINVVFKLVARSLIPVR